jgi:hypothetical protein
MYIASSRFGVYKYESDLVYIVLAKSLINIIWSLSYLY